MSRALSSILRRLVIFDGGLRLRHRTSRFAVVLALLLGASTGRSAALPDGDTLRITFSDDLISGNEHPDDLYTAELAFETRFGGHSVRLGERMFTRRELGRRFDETYLDVGLGRRSIGRVVVDLRIGAQRVGKGLGGESLQNQVHRWVGSDRVDLRYVDSVHWYPTIEARFALPAVGETPLAPWLELYAAPGFRQWARGGLRFERSLGQRATLRLGVGGALHRTQNELLRGAVARSGALAELGVSWKAWSLRWAYNDYGVHAETVTFAVDLRQITAHLGD